MKVLPGAVALILLTACSGERRETTVSDAWVRLPAVAGRPAAAYFVLHGGRADATLTRVSTTAAIRTELHRSGMQGNMATMQPLGSMPLPAGTTVAFAPGGNHAMLFDVDPSVVAGSTVALAFDFADGRHLTAQAKAVAAGDPAPATK